MKRIFFLLALSVFGNALFSQVYVPGDHNDWDLDVDNQATLKTHFGGSQVYYGKTIQVSIDNQFKVVSGSFGTDWGGGYWINSYDQRWAPTYNGANAIWKGSPNSFIHLCIEDPSDYLNSNLPIGIMTLSAAPVNFASVSQVGILKNSIYYTNTLAQTISINLEHAKASEEKVYLRYTTDGWATDNFVLASGSGTSYTAEIPGQVNGIQVQYYVFSTTLSYSDGNDLDNYPDLMTINYENNSGNLYKYTSTDPRSINDGNWSSEATWLFGSVPTNGNVIISNDDEVTLNEDRSLNTIIIDNGGIFIASDATPRTLTISSGGTLTNNGTFTAGSGKVSFAGAGTVSGTVVFNDVDIAGGVNFGASSTINGDLTVLAGGAAITNAPTFASTSNLIFATGGPYNIGNGTILWTTGSTLGKGVPANVIVSTTTPLNIYETRYVTGNLTINSSGTVVQGNNGFTIQGDFTNAGAFSFVADGASPLVVKGNLINQSDAVINLSNEIGGDMHLEGDYQSSGTVNFNNRAIFFKGGNAQSVSGANNPINFDYLFVEKTAATTLTFDQIVSINNKFDQISGNATIASGKTLTIDVSAVADIASGSTLTTNGNLILSSDINGTGSLIVNGTVSGDVTIRRYLTNYDNATDAKYHFISSPVSDQKIQDVMDGEVVSVENFVTDPPSAGVDFYKFNELTNTWINSKEGTSPNFTWVTGFGDNFEVGRGYLVAYPTAPVTKSFSGTLNNNASYPFSCTNTPGQGEGWNLLGNPYPAAIDWTAVTLGDGMDNALYYYDAANQKYVAYLRITGDVTTDLGGSRYIPAMQGFMVHAKTTGTKTVTIEKADLTHLGQDNFYKSTRQLVKGSLALIINGNNFEDEAYIHFNANASEQFDGSYDAYKLMSANNHVPMIYTTDGNGDQLAINGMPEVEEGTTIPVSLRIGQEGTYTIQASISEIETNIFLEDLVTDITTKLNDNPTYSFTASAGDSPDRFLLHFGVVGLGEQDAASQLQAYVYGDQLYVMGAEGQTQLSVYDIQGRLVQQAQANLSGLYSQSLKLPAGVYVVRLQNETASNATKIVIK